MNDNSKKIWWYTWRSMLLLVYVIGGLFGFMCMLLWNHGLFGGGAEVLPGWFEMAVFVIWIIGGFIGLFLISRKSIKKSFLIVLWAAVAVILFLLIKYVLDDLIPDMSTRMEVNNIKESADDLCDVPIDYRYITLYLDADENKLHYWSRTQEEPRHYDAVRTFSMKEVNVDFSHLNETLIMYKLTSESGELYCLSGPEYYSEIEEIYWLYDGQMYHAVVDNISWSGVKEELWEQYNKEYFDKRNGR